MFRRLFIFCFLLVLLKVAPGPTFAQSQIPLNVYNSIVPIQDRNCKWTINKTANVSNLTLKSEELNEVTYKVNLGKECATESWGVVGWVDIINPNDVEAIITKVDNVISGDPTISLDLNCFYVDFGGNNVPIDFRNPYVLNGRNYFTCVYKGKLPNAETREFTVAVYSGEQSPVPGNTTEGKIDFINVQPFDTDGCVGVNDNQFGPLSSELCDDETFTYSLQIGCGKYQFINTASFITKDTKTTGSSSWVVAVDLPCFGCVLTEGYWKNHGDLGRRYDPTWNFIGPSTDFFSSGKSYLEVLNINPLVGNAYYQLAHQYIAAELNRFKGASLTSNVYLALNWAKTYFEDLIPSTDKTSAIKWAEILTKYNEGLTGPARCKE